MVSDCLGLMALNPASAPLIDFFSFYVNSPAFQFNVTLLHHLEKENHNSICLTGPGRERNALKEGQVYIYSIVIIIILNLKIFDLLSLSVQGNESN